MASEGATAGAGRRVALVGVNARAERFLIPGLLGAGNSTLVALCSRSPEKAATVAARHGVPHAYDSVAALIAAGVADTIFVNTPAGAHQAPAVAAARAGMAVICEKPLAESATAGRAIAEAVAGAAVPSAVHFTYRGLAGGRMVARLLERGVIGRLLLIQIAMLQAKELQPPLAGRSALVELGSHSIDLCGWWASSAGAGPDLELTGAGGARRAGQDQDDSVEALLRTGGQALVSFLVSRTAHGFGNGLRALLCGEAGTLEITMDADTVLIRQATSSTPFTTVPVDDDLQVSYSAFPAVQMRALVASLDGSGQFPTIQEALAVQVLQDQIARQAGFDPEVLAAAGR